MLPSNTKASLKLGSLPGGSDWRVGGCCYLLSTWLRPNMMMVTITWSSPFCSPSSMNAFLTVKMIAKHSENGMVFTTVDDGCRISFAIDTIIRYSHKISNTLCLKALRYNFTMHMDGCSPMLLDIHNYNL